VQSSWQRDGSPDTTITASVAATPRRILVNVRGSLTRAGVPAHPSRRVPVDRSRAHRTCRSALRELGLRRRQRAVEAYAADEPCKTALHSGAAGPGHGELARVPDAAPGESFAVRECAANPGGPTRVHFGCTRSPSAVVSGRLTSPRNRRFAALLTTGDDCRLPLTFSDKEEVPGSSPGSPTPILPAHRHFSCGQMAGYEFLDARRGCIWGADATSSLQRGVRRTARLA
jgi:hypothetical protein